MNWGFWQFAYLILWNLAMFIIVDAKVGKKIETVMEFDGLLAVAVFGAIGFALLFMR